MRIPAPARAAPLALLLALAAPLPGAAGGEPGGLHFRRTWLEALTEARVRGVPALVSRHKDF